MRSPPRESGVQYAGLVHVVPGLAPRVDRGSNAGVRLDSAHPASVDGLPGLREYLVTTRRQAVVRQFCRKLLGYALGRAVQLSDEPLLAEMGRRLARKAYRFSDAVDFIVRSRQFREIRGQ